MGIRLHGNQISSKILNLFVVMENKYLNEEKKAFWRRTVKK